MSDSLPPELIDSILSHLCGTPSIAQCALVCHSWLPSARYHLLPPPKVLHLDQIQIAEFFQLIDSPQSTLSMTSINTLHLIQNKSRANRIPPDQNARRNHTTRDLPLPSITSLFLEWIDWRTLLPAALTSLHNSCNSVKELELRWIAITSSELCNLLAALTALEKLTVGEGAAFDPASWTVHSVQLTHPHLCQLAFSYSPPWIIQFFARAIGYTAGIVGVFVDLPMQSDNNGNLQKFKACGELLEAAGTSLRVLKLQISYEHIHLSVNDTVFFAELLGFPRNPNLEEIELNTINEITFNLLLQGLKLNAKPNLRQLKLVLEDRHRLADSDELGRWSGKWEFADEALSTMLLKDPKLIVELPSLRSQPWDHDSAGIPAFEGAYSARSRKTLWGLLPRTAEYWKTELKFRDY